MQLPQHHVGMMDEPERDLTQSQQVLDASLVSLQSESFRELVEDRFDRFWEEHAGAGSTETPSELGKISFTPVRSSRLLEVSAEHEHPIVAAISANVAAEVAQDFFLEKNERDVEQAVKFFKGQVHKQKSELASLEGVHEGFRVEHQLDLKEGKLMLAKSALQGLRNSLLETNQAILREEAKVERYTAQNVAGDDSKKAELQAKIDGLKAKQMELKEETERLSEHLHQDQLAFEQLQAKEKAIKENVHASKRELNRLISLMELEKEKVEQYAVRILILERAIPPEKPVK